MKFQLRKPLQRVVAKVDFKILKRGRPLIAQLLAISRTYFRHQTMATLLVRSNHPHCSAHTKPMHTKPHPSSVQHPKAPTDVPLVPVHAPLPSQQPPTPPATKIFVHVHLRRPLHAHSPPVVARLTVSRIPTLANRQ